MFLHVILYRQNGCKNCPNWPIQSLNWVSWWAFDYLSLFANLIVRLKRPFLLLKWGIIMEVIIMKKKLLFLICTLFIGAQLSAMDMEGYFLPEFNANIEAIKQAKTSNAIDQISKETLTRAQLLDRVCADKKYVKALEIAIDNAKKRLEEAQQIAKKRKVSEVPTESMYKVATRQAIRAAGKAGELAGATKLRVENGAAKVCDGAIAVKPHVQNVAIKSAQACRATAKGIATVAPHVGKLGKTMVFVGVYGGKVIYYSSYYGYIALSKTVDFIYEYSNWVPWLCQKGFNGAQIGCSATATACGWLKNLYYKDNNVQTKVTQDEQSDAIPSAPPVEHLPAYNPELDNAADGSTDGLYPTLPPATNPELKQAENFTPDATAPFLEDEVQNERHHSNIYPDLNVEY